MDMDDDDHYGFLTDMQVVESEIEKFLKLQFPSTYKDMFVMQTFLPIPKNESHCYFRAKIPMKDGISQTYFTGNGRKETKRWLTSEDLNHNSTVVIEVQCDNWWIADKSVGYTFVINDMILC
jgi:hypothetical protein